MGLLEDGQGPDPPSLPRGGTLSRLLIMGATTMSENFARRAISGAWQDNIRSLARLSGGVGIISRGDIARCSDDFRNGHSRTGWDAPESSEVGERTCELGGAYAARWTRFGVRRNGDLLRRCQMDGGCSHRWRSVAEFCRSQVFRLAAASRSLCSPPPSALSPPAAPTSQEKRAS